MKWQYTGYPYAVTVSVNGKDLQEVRVSSGAVEIKLTKPPRFQRIAVGEGFSCVVPRPVDLPSCRWKIATEVSDDLERFIRGKYGYQIEVRLVADYLAGAMGMPEAASAYDKFLGHKPKPQPVEDDWLNAAVNDAIEAFAPKGAR